MGTYLDKPIIDKETVLAELQGIQVCVSSMQGWRTTMEVSIFFMY